MTRPTTDTTSKRVMLRAERGDTIFIQGFGRFEVTRRQPTYFGPKLLVTPADAAGTYTAQLTAPGPDRDLRLWFPDRDEPGWRHGFVRGPEVTAAIDDVGQYDICPRCGDPIKTAEHERLAAFGICEAGFE